MAQIKSSKPVLFDSSVYITAMRRRNMNFTAARNLLNRGPLWLSAVVLEELYAGVNESHRKIIEQLERDFTKARRIVVPNATDWAQTGLLLGRLGAKYGYDQIARGRLTNDALIAVSASRQGITILTLNARDFARIAEFRAFDWEVV